MIGRGDGHEWLLHWVTPDRREGANRDARGSDVEGLTGPGGAWHDLLRADAPKGGHLQELPGVPSGYGLRQTVGSGCGMRRLALPRGSREMPGSAWSGGELSDQRRLQRTPRLQRGDVRVHGGPRLRSRPAVPHGGGQLAGILLLCGRHGLWPPRDLRRWASTRLQVRRSLRARRMKLQPQMVRFRSEGRSSTFLPTLVLRAADPLCGGRRSMRPERDREPMQVRVRMHRERRRVPMPLSVHGALAGTRLFRGQVLGMMFLLAVAVSGCAKTECESQADCSNDEYCDKKVLYGTDVCEDRGDRGDSCKTHAYGTPGWDRSHEQGSCKEGLLCFRTEGAEAVCRPPQGVGGFCWTVEYCKEGLTCDKENSPEGGRCRPRSAVGGPCVHSLDCLQGSYCTGGGRGGTCQAEIREGESCGAFDECEGELVCAKGICSEKEGLPCDTDRDCYGGLYCIEGSCGRD